MLHVPTLRQDQEPFDINQKYAMSPPLNGGHALALPQAPDNPSPADAPADDIPDLTPVLDHTLVKEAVTTLHIEDDEEERKLLAYSRSQICDIVPDYLRFIKAQKDKYNALLKTGRQRHVFAIITRAYFGNAPARAETLRNRRIRQFQREVIERQNQEFTARALRPEAVMDDHVQRQYRDMILHNIELLLADAEPQERERAMNDASRELYAAIMDARLSLDPASLAPLLDSPAVRRVLPREVLATYRTTMDQAIRRDKLLSKAQQWVEEKKTPGDVRRMISEQHPSPDDQALLRALFGRIRTNFFRKHSLQTIFDAEVAWNELKKKEYAFEALPAWVKNSDQELLDCMATLQSTRARHGGAPQMPEYCHILRFIEEFDPEKAAESLSRKEKVYELIIKAGGFESPLYAALVRLLLGTLTAKDKNWFDCLIQAKKSCAGDDDRFIAECDTARRIRLAKRDCGEMDTIEMNEILESIRACGQ